MTEEEIAAQEANNAKYHAIGLHNITFSSSPIISLFKKASPWRPCVLNGICFWTSTLTTSTIKCSTGDDGNQLYELGLTPPKMCPS